MRWSEFFHMGGYAFYVWGSYLVSLVVLGAEVLTVIRCRKRSGVRSGAGSRLTKSDNQ